MTAATPFGARTDVPGDRFSAGPDDLFWVDLQWFAAEDEGRTEDPTEQKIRKAREEGKVAKSQDFTSALVLLFSVVALGIASSYMVGTGSAMMKFFYTRVTQWDVTRDTAIWGDLLIFFLKMIWPVTAVAFAAAFLGNVAQVGFLFSVKPITPDFSKISPNFVKFFKRAMFSGEAAFNLAKSIVKILIIALIAYLNIRSQLPQLVSSVSRPFTETFARVASTAFRIMIEAALAMIAFALPDYLFQRHQHRESLKMTKQEVKEEHKMSDGDPLVKNRLRERMREIMSQNLMEAVPEADVVITNPTHYAVAMEWKQEKMAAPTVCAKGQDEAAQRIKKIARDHDVPIMENKPLARALYAEVEVGEAIPSKFYEVMALVLAEVYKTDGAGVSQ